jgi:hypothetical protein
MVITGELRKIKLNIANLENVALYSLRDSAKNIIHDIENIPTEWVKDTFFINYVEKVIKQHLFAVEEFLDLIDESFEQDLVFIKKSLIYQLNCIIDSYTYACIVRKIHCIDIV